MDYLPLFVDVRQQSCLVVGAGDVARRKIELLLRAGARVDVIAPEVIEAVQELANAGRIRLERRVYRPQDVRGRRLVIAATDQPRVNAQIFDLCVTHGQLVNSVDAPEISNCIFPALVDRSPITVAISSAGRAPALSRVVRGWIERRLPAGLGRLADFVADHRDRVRQTFAEIPARQRFWQRLLDGPVPERLGAGDEAGAERAFEEALARPDRGQVALVGAGPGDPELLTLKGFRLLQSADVILYDNLANRALLDYARRDAEQIYVGKKRRFPGIRQEGIHALMLEHARAGKHVVRLKGGDPFVFGRGGEETEVLAEAGIDCLVVPGITAAMGAASYAGIPLTHRDRAQSVRFVTGHRASDRTNLDWPELARPDQTLVIYMGLPGLETILENLVRHGLAADTPAALVEKATLPEQRLVVGTVADLAARVRAAEVVGPTTIIVGAVVAERHGGVTPEVS